jgi:hypothetical protein
VNNNPQQPEPMPITALIAALVAAALGPLIWVGCYLWFGYAYVAGLLIGLAIGGAMRLAGRSGSPALPVIAVVLTVLAALVGFVWVEQSFIKWNPGFEPGVGESLARFFRDISALLFTGFGAYIAYTMAPRNT